MNLMLRHCLATLRYRTRRALADTPSDFGTFSAGHDVRAPVELLRHMTHLAEFSCSQVQGEPGPALEPLGSLDAERAQFERALRDLSLALASREISVETASRLLQGPISDAMTHAGQLAMLRRMAGVPAPAENFFAATIDPADLES